APELPIRDAQLRSRVPVHARTRSESLRTRSDRSRLGPRSAFSCTARRIPFALWRLTPYSLTARENAFGAGKRFAPPIRRPSRPRSSALVPDLRAGARFAVTPPLPPQPATPLNGVSS